MANTPTKSWADIATKASDNSLTISLEESDGTYLVCGKLPEGVTSLYEAFSLGESLTDIVFTDSFDTSKVTDMSFMFSGCSALTSLDLSKFNTGNVIFMGAMFSNCNSLNKLNLSSFNTSKVNDMNHMFSSCSSLTSLDLGKFDTQNVMLMTGMFSNCNLLTSLDLTNFNTTNCVRMGGNYIPDDGMFYNCSSLISLKLGDKFITNNTKIMRAMFANCSKLTDLDLGSFEISNETNIHLLFSGCTSLQNIKMPNIIADSTIKLSDLSLPNDKSWYSLASGDSKGTLVADTNVSANTYAGHILTINQNKSYAEIDKIITNATKPSTPETPSTGVMLDVILPVVSISVVLASLCAVAFVGKKKKQF